MDAEFNVTTLASNVTNATSPATTSTQVMLITSTLRPLTEDEQYEILVRYNDAKAQLYVPVIIYMLLLTLVGTFGNVLVCCVYSCRLKKTSSHYFILTLAVLDLLTCVIGMPTEITDLRYPYMFYASAACKLLRFVESVTTMGSSIILISVAVDRFLRICKLGKQISVIAAKRICFSALFVGILLSWPACLIFGRSTQELEQGIYGVDCSTDDSMHNTHYPSMYYGFLGLLFIGCLIFFSIIYIQIGLKIWRQKKIGQKRNRDSGFSSVKGRKFSASSTKDSVGTETNGNHVPVDADNNKIEAAVDNGSDPISTDMSSDQMNTSYNSKKKCISDKRVSYVSSASSKADAPKKREIKITRTTVTLFAVTVAYIISYLPFLVVMVMRSIKKDLEDNLSPTEEVVFKFCTKSYFINNAINPIIYSYLNMNFRKDAKGMIRRLARACCCCRRSSAD